MADEVKPARTFTDEFVQKVLKALEDDRFKWRTLHGIAKSSSLAEPDVEAVIEAHPDIIIKSRVPSVDGSALYTTRTHFLAKASPLEKLAGAFRNRVY